MDYSHGWSIRKLLRWVELAKCSQHWKARNSPDFPPRPNWDGAIRSVDDTKVCLVAGTQSKIKKWELNCVCAYYQSSPGRDMAPRYTYRPTIPILSDIIEAIVSCGSGNIIRQARNIIARQKVAYRRNLTRIRPDIYKLIQLYCS